MTGNEALLALGACVFVALIFALQRAAARGAALEAQVHALEAQTSALQDRAGEHHLEWRTLLNTIQDPTLVFGADGNCETTNEAADIFLPHATGQTLLKLTQSTELQTLIRESQGISSSLLPSVAEVALHHPEERAIQAIISPLPSRRVLVILRDLTALRHLETVRRDFVANVSHELRTPLSSVKAMAETLMDGALEDREVARHFLETIIHESDRLARLSADLLDLSRVEALPVTKVPVDLGPLIPDIVSRFSSPIRRAGHQVFVDVPGTLIVPCDPDDISQVLVNLLDNAIKYTPTCGVIRIWAEVDAATMTVNVSDTGIGILQQDVPRVFERFYRTDKARSRGSGGTGLGLSIVKHIVERHDGCVSVSSNYNNGSTFSFTLPRA